jgi:acetolactate synthase I/II/III large subunit
VSALSLATTLQQRRTRDVRKRTADILVDTLAAAGVDVVFGLPGGSIAPVFDALVDRPEIKVVTTRHDGNAVFSAAGYAQASGRIGVAIVTSGPGVLNCMNAIASAFTDGLPVLVLTGEAPRRGFGKNAIQEGSSYSLNVVGMTKHITKMSAEVTDGAAAASMLREAISTAMNGKRGPVVLSLPLDILGQQTSSTRSGARTTTHFEIDTAAVAHAARALNANDKKLIFVGSGARAGRTPALLRQLAERLQAPVVTTPKGKGIFPEDHPLSLGVFGMGGHPSARSYVRQGVDTVLVIGSSLNEVATEGWSQDLAARRCLIHVDIDGTRIGRVYPADVPVAAPADLFLETLLPRIDAGAPAQPHRIEYADDPRGLEQTEDGKISPVRVLWELQRIVPSDTIYTTDSGNNLFFAIHYLKVTEPDSFMSMLGLGSMGVGLPAAIGAQLAHPERRVVSVIGDGGLLMCAGELSVAAQHRLPIVVLVLNDMRYNMVEHGNRNVYGRTAPYPTGPIDVAELARGCGAQAVVVERPGQLESLSLSNLRGPLVIDARIAAKTKLPPNGRFETIQTNLRTLTN